MGIEQPLGDRHQVAGDEDLVDQLGVLAAARRPLQDDGPAQALEQRPHAREHRRLAADHDRQPRLAGASTSPPDTGASRLATPRPRRGVDLARQRGLAGGHVDQHRAGRGAGERAVGPEHPLAHVVREADHGEDDVRALRRGARRVRPCGAAREQRRRPRRRAGEDGRRMSAVEEMAAHRRPHDTSADPTDPHRSRPLSSSGPPTASIGGDRHPRVPPSAAARRASPAGGRRKRNTKRLEQELIATVPIYLAC